MPTQTDIMIGKGPIVPETKVLSIQVKATTYRNLGLIAAALATLTTLRYLMSKESDHRLMIYRAR